MQNYNHKNGHYKLYHIHYFIGKKMNTHIGILMSKMREYHMIPKIICL